MEQWKKDKAKKAAETAAEKQARQLAAEEQRQQKEIDEEKIRLEKLYLEMWEKKEEENSVKYSDERHRKN